MAAGVILRARLSATLRVSVGFHSSDLSIDYLDSLGGHGDAEFETARELLEPALGKD